MFPAQDLFVFRAEQNIGDMTCAKFLIRAFDTGEEFLRVNGDVDQRSGGGGAVVAIGAIVGLVGFAKVVQKRLASADPLIFRVTHDRIQMLNGDAFFAAFFLIDEIIDLGDI